MHILHIQSTECIKLHLAPKMKNSKCHNNAHRGGCCILIDLPKVVAILLDNQLMLV